MRRVFDAHFHVIDPRFPLRRVDGFLPQPFTAEDYRARVAGSGVVGGAVVAGSFHGFDQAWLLDALRRLGDAFVGVAQIPVSISDEEVDLLAAAGVRGVRFNLYRGPSVGLDALASLAHRVHDLAGWHAEVYVGPGDLPDLASWLRGLPRVVIDHLGLSTGGLRTLVRLVEAGLWVKASGFGRGLLDVRTALHRLYTANPNRVVFGTDLPGTRARRPFLQSDVDLILECLGEEGGTQVLLHNGLGLYGFG